MFFTEPELHEDNDNTYKLTLEKLRSYPGLEQLSDEQATEAAKTLRRLATILFEIHCFKEATCIDNQHVVYLQEQKRAA